MGRLTATKDAIVIEPDAPLMDRTVDVLIDGRRVWSLHPPEPDERGLVRIKWPRALRPYLHGQAEMTLRSSGTGDIRAQGHVRIGYSSAPLQVRDAHGHFLAMNKWNRLGPSFEGDESGVKERLLASGQRLIEHLQELGYPIFVVGGTLLGAMRSGALLPHDDDMDLAWVCRETNPLDISLASMKMERELVERGYTCIRLSMAHLQITFFDAEDRTDHYIDIFTGFFMDGLYGQPFALRGPLAPEDLEPVSTVSLNGVEFPAPAKPEVWLEFAYGESWLVPDPSFKFVTPRSTKRRFENWFGVFNRSRVFWEKTFSKLDVRPLLTEGNDEVDRFLTLVPKGARVLDMGSSDGRLTERIAAAGHPVLGVDYSYEALRLARRTAPPGVDYRYLNFNDRHALLDFGMDLIETGEPWYFCANYLLAGVPRQGRQNIFLFLRLMLEGDSFAYASIDTNFSRAYRRDRPDSWHMPLDWLHNESRAFGLQVDVIHSGHRSTTLGRRATSSVVIRRAVEDSEKSEERA
ncbi:MAG TPA: LicD family protein [Microbacteriaceae bacterium]